MRYRVRGILKAGAVPVIHKVDAINVYAAAAEAGRILKDDGHDPFIVESLTVKPMASSKATATYFGKSTKGRKRGTPVGAAAPAAPAAPAASAPAAKAADPKPAAAPAAPAPAAKAADPKPEGKGGKK